MRSDRRLFMRLRLHGFLVGVLIAGSLIAIGPAGLVLAATFAVNSNLDGHDATPGNGICETAIGNGICTLRAAIEEANALGGANTITLPAMTITLSLSTALNAEPQITSNITINGAMGAGLTTNIQASTTAGTASTRVLTVTGSGNATISLVRIRYGMVTPTACGVSVNGGGILNNGALTLNNSDINDNAVAVGCGGGGGGVYNTGMLTLNGTIVQNNTDNGGGSGGGGIANDSNGKLIVNGGTFSSNHSKFGGGGIGNSGDLTASGTFFGNNSVDQGGGGAIYSQGTMSLDSLTVITNTATTGCGGGIATIFNTATLSNSTVVRNQAPASCGGGIYLDQAAQMTISNSTIGGTAAGDGNTAISGGGIYNTGTLTLQNGTRVLANIANGTMATNGGGGIYNDYDGINAGSGVLVVDASVIGVAGSGNTAHRGGGIYNRGGIVTVRNTSSVSANTGLFGGGGILNDKNTTGTIHGGQVTVDNSVVGGMTAGDGNTATMANSALGGGIYDPTQGDTVTLQNNARVQRNLANGGSGGGIFSEGFLQVTASTVSNNSALTAGGLFNGSELTMATSTVRDNTGNCLSGDCGGGILLSSDAIITQSTISGNGGGGISEGGGGLTLTNSTISGNGGAGGGFSTSCPDACGTLTATLTNVTIANNSFGITGANGQLNGTVAIKNSILSNLGANCTGTAIITSGDYNISSGPCAKLTAPHDRTNLNPQIGPLANNGGLTQTHALLGNSPAFNAIPKPGNGSPAVDQRGVARPQGPGYDIGAFEAQPNPAPPPRPGPSMPGVPAPIPPMLR